MTKLIVVFRNSKNAPKSGDYLGTRLSTSELHCSFKSRFIHLISFP